jgi:hypothetical protein
MPSTYNWVSSKLHVPQNQPGEYSGGDDEDWYEASISDLLRLGELFLFGVSVADMADASGGGGCRGEDGGGQDRLRHRSTSKGVKLTRGAPPRM